LSEATIALAIKDDAMSDQSPEYAQPQVLQPAAVYAPPPPPPKRGGGFFRAIMILFTVFGVLSVLLVVGMFALVGSIRLPTTDVEEEYVSGDRRSRHKVAIVPVEDIIMDLTAKHVIDALKAAKEDDAVKAVVLKVDSPGGTISASDHIHRKVKELCRGPGKTKPMVVSMQGLAASGGYYVSAPADKIFAERTTMTGSIGVIASFPNVAGLMQDFKVRMEVIKTGPLKDSGSMFREMSDEERKRWQALIDDAFQTFIDVVTEGRKMDESRVRELATGEVYTAREAKANGLIDEIGYLEDAVAAAEKLAGISDSHVIEYKRPLSLSDLLLGSANSRQSEARDLRSLFRANVPRLMFLTQVASFEL
jgi:protease-4